MEKVYYNSCPQNNHDDELMNLVCLQNQCYQKRLFCAECKEEYHSEHKVTSLKRFLQEYKEQSKQWITGQNQQQRLTQYIDQMIIILQDSSKIIQESFIESINKLEQTKEIVKQFGKNEKQEQQLQILEQIGKSENMQKDLASLLESVQSFSPSQGFTFLLKQENNTLDSIDQRINNAQQTAYQQQSLMNTITDTITKSNETLSTQLQSLFKDKIPNQPLQQETHLSNYQPQPQTNTNINIRPLPQQSVEEELSNNEPLELNEESQFQVQELVFERNDPVKVCTTPVMKILLIDNDTHLIVLTHTGKIIQFNYQTDQIITQQQITTEIDSQCSLSDATYSILHNQLYLACKTGKLYIYSRNINKLNQPFIYYLSQKADKIGLLLIQEHEAEKNVFTVGEERILKSFSAITGREVARYDGFNDYPRVLLFDKERNQIFLGGNKIVMVFDQRNKTMKKSIEIEQKITNIQIDGNEIVLMLESKIKYVNSTSFTTTNEKMINNRIVSSALFQKWNMIIVCENQSQPQLKMYCIQSGFVENIGKEDATIICVKVIKDITYVFIGERSGYIVKYCVRHK